MTDKTKYKNLSIGVKAYATLDKVRKAIVPNTTMSRSQTVEMLINKEAKHLNGKIQKKE
jgi:hypothetical protein|tara:strand:- start:229 stop:405 length:177 start_codon:yes stop_codon:yes gene_type:complete